MPADTSMIQIEKPGPPSIVAELSPLVQQAREFSVTDVASDGLALERVRSLRAGEKRITEYFEPARKAADAAKKEILAARDGLIGPIAAARAIYDSKAAAFEAEERRKADEEQRRLQAQAKKDEEERALMAAIEADEAGDHAEAEAIMSEPVSVATVTVAPAVAQVEGVSSQVRYSAEVTDLMALIQYVATRPEWVSLLEPNMPNLNRLATAQRKALSIPGVRAVDRVIRSTR